MTPKEVIQAIVRETIDAIHGIPHPHDCTLTRHKTWPTNDHKTILKHQCRCGNTWTTHIHDTEWVKT